MSYKLSVKHPKLLCSTSVKVLLHTNWNHVIEYEIIVQVMKSMYSILVLFTRESEGVTLEILFPPNYFQQKLKNSISHTEKIISTIPYPQPLGVGGG